MRPYRCSKCKAKGCKLWRGYSCSRVELLCTNCTEAHERKTLDVDSPSEIGWHVAAIPDEDGNWWGYTSVPADRCAWWYALPTRPGAEVGAVEVAMLVKFATRLGEAASLLPVWAATLGGKAWRPSLLRRPAVLVPRGGRVQGAREEQEATMVTPKPTGRPLLTPYQRECLNDMARGDKRPWCLRATTLRVLTKLGLVRIVADRCPEHGDLGAIITAKGRRAIEHERAGCPDVQQRIREKLDAKLAEKRAAAAQPMANPPRYDEVWAEGMQRLEEEP